MSRTMLYFLYWNTIINTKIVFIIILKEFIIFKCIVFYLFISVFSVQFELFYYVRLI